MNTVAFAAPGFESLIADSDGKTPQNISDWSYLGMQESPSVVTYSFEHKDHGALNVVLEAFDPQRPAYAKSDSFIIIYTGEITSSARQVAVIALMDELSTRIKANDNGILTLKKRGDAEQKTPANTAPDKQAALSAPVPALPFWLDESDYSDLRILELRTIQILMILSLLALILLILRLGKDFRNLPRRESSMLLSAFFGGLLLRLLMPFRSVSAYEDYGFINRILAGGEFSGLLAGAHNVQSILIGILPGGAHAIPFFNSLLGFGIIALAAIWLENYSRKPFSAFVLSLLLFLNPVLMAEQASFSPLLPGTFFFFQGLNHIEVFRRRSSWIHICFAAVTLLLSAFCLPLMILAIPLVLRFTGNTQPADPGRKTPQWLRIVFLFITVALMLPHLSFLTVQFSALFEKTPTALNSVKEFALYWATLAGHTHLLASPIIIILLWFALIFRPDNKEYARASALILCGILFSILFGVEEAASAMPHGDSPAIIFSTMLAGLGLMHLMPVDGHGLRIKIKPVLLAVIFLAYLPHMYLTLKSSAEDEDYLLYRNAIEALPDMPVAFAALSPGDPPVMENINLEPPEWLWAERGHKDRRLNLIGWWNLYRVDAISEPSYIYIGPRCFVRSSSSDTQPDGEKDSMHPACKRIIENIEAEAVLSQALNRNSRSFGRFVYDPEQSCKDCIVGLYKIKDLKNREEWKAVEDKKPEKKTEYGDHDRIRQKARPF